MQWDASIQVVSGGGVSADPIAAPATVVAANCFRLPKRDPQSFTLNTRVLFGLTGVGVVAAETVSFEMYVQNDADDLGGEVPNPAGRWSKVGAVIGLAGGSTALLDPFVGGGADARGGLCYVRVINETTANNRQLVVKACPGGGQGFAIGAPSESSALDQAAQVWPSLAGAAADPTAAYVASTRTFWVGKRAFLHGNAIVTLAAGAVVPEAILILVERSLNFGGAWAEYATVTIPASAVGTHRFDLQLSEYALYRISAMRSGGTANTRLVITADVVETPAFRGRDGLAIELQNAKEVGLLCWHNAGAAEALGLAYAASTSGVWNPVGRANRAGIVTTLSVNAATTHEIQVHESPDATPTDLIRGVTNSVVAGVVNQTVRQYQLGGAVGTYLTVLEVEPGSRIRIYAKYTGGAAPNCIGRLYLWRQATRT